METAIDKLAKDIVLLKRQVRRLIKESWVYTDHEICIFCSEYFITRKHGPNCELKKAQLLLKSIDI